MELYLDTANVAEVERLARVFPIAGVTTNPSIIAASRESIWSVLPRLQKAIGPRGTLFAQTMSRDAGGMVAEAKRLSNALPDIVVKIPVTAEGLVAIKALKNEGITTLGTAVYSAAQGLLAALAGASYVAAYVNKGLFPLSMKWKMKYTHGLKVIPNQSLAFLEYKFFDADKNELDMKEEKEIINK